MRVFDMDLPVVRACFMRRNQTYYYRPLHVWIYLSFDGLESIYVGRLDTPLDKVSIFHSQSRTAHRRCCIWVSLSIVLVQRARLEPQRSTGHCTYEVYPQFDGPLHCKYLRRSDTTVEKYRSFMVNVEHSKTVPGRKYEPASLLCLLTMRKIELELSTSRYMCIS